MGSMYTPCKRETEARKEKSTQHIVINIIKQKLVSGTSIANKKSHR